MTLHSSLKGKIVSPLCLNLRALLSLSQTPCCVRALITPMSLVASTVTLAVSGSSLRPSPSSPSRPRWVHAPRRADILITSIPLLRHPCPSSPLMSVSLVAHVSYLPCTSSPTPLIETGRACVSGNACTTRVSRAALATSSLTVCADQRQTRNDHCWQRVVHHSTTCSLMLKTDPSGIHYRRSCRPLGKR